MTKVTPTSKLKRDNLSWFEIGRYEKTKSWNVSDWVGHLSIRYLLKGVIDRGEAFSKEPNNFHTSQILFQLLTNPVPTNGGSAGGVLAKGGPRIWDRTVIDVFDASARLDREIYQDVIAMAEEWHRQIDETGKFPEIPALLNRGFIDLIYERFPNSFPYEEVYVDLNASDVQLTNDFKNWLANKRKTRSSNAPKRDFTNADLYDWYRYRVLAYIDIDLFCHFTNSNISQATLGNLLFPEEYDVDVSERIRKVVKPLASRLMTNEYLSALDEQAARVERKSA